MSNIVAYSFSPDNHGFSHDKWDFGLLADTFKINRIDVVPARTLPTGDKAFVVVPGYEWSGKEQRLSEELLKIHRVVLFITSDEGGTIDVSQIVHPNIAIWVQYPYQKHSSYNLMPVGSPNHIHRLTPKEYHKTMDVFFAGQVTHQRRKQLQRALLKMNNATYNFTAGFSQGDTPEEYYKKLSGTKISPAPAGVLSIDSFRFYEALESLSIPIADSVSSVGENYGFWELLFKDMPVPQVSNWEEELQPIVNELLYEYPANMHKIVAWWIKYKRDFAIKIMEQINEH